ncbi:MAG: ABC transporter permease [Thermomicrobiales bacterium]|nr:ABC transporter permease [Thermomicrobiales bacterium]
MGSFILRRVMLLVPIWIGISLLAFLLTNLTPGDPARLALQRELGHQPDTAQVEEARERMGLNDPLPIQYLRWLGHAATGDLGTSYRNGQPVLEALSNRFPTTLKLAALGLAISVTIALPLGALAAVFRGRVVDHFSRIFALVGASMPSFWVAYLLILAFAVNLRLLPVAGSSTWKHIVLPAVTLGIAGSASLMRVVRSEMLENLGQDYVRTARAKGLANSYVISRHAFRNALIPVTTILGMRFAGMLGGTVIVETIFAWPGIGKLIIDAIFDRDYPIIQGFVIFMGTVTLLINLTVDIGYGLIDPRVRPAKS